jgi:hypothetical protein
MPHADIKWAFGPKNRPDHWNAFHFQDNPLIYWGTDSGILLAGICLFAGGFYRGRK